MQPRMDLVVRTSFTLKSCVHRSLASSQGDVGKQKPDESSFQPMRIPHPLPGPACTTQPLSTPSPMAYNYISPDPNQPLSTPSPVFYNYINPVTGEHVVSLLAPNHPEMICLQSGSHLPFTRFGFLGEHQSSHCPYILLNLTFLC
jgi:hypothetical protein